MGLRQSDIEGLSERQVRRIEKREPISSEALQRLAADHKMSSDEYLKAVAENVAAQAQAG